MVESREDRKKIGATLIFVLFVSLVACLFLMT